MKKSLFFSILLASVLLISGCHAPELPIGTYVFEASQDAVKPTVTLEKDHTFSFFYSPVTSYHPSGTYKTENGQLLLQTKDTAENQTIAFVFDIRHGELIYRADLSTPISSLAQIPDGAVFKK